MTDSARRKLLARAVARLKLTKEGYHPTGPNWRPAMALLDELDNDLKPDPPDTVPPIGPVSPGGTSLLKLSLTHQTSGLPLFPALDTAFTAGSRIIAPEPGKVTRHSGNDNSGYSVYLTGKSGLRYYFQHLNPEGRAALGTIAKGDKIGTVGSATRFPGARVSHCHVGVNAEAIAGKGKQLKYGANGNGPDYTLGAPTIGAQLAKF